MKRFVSEMMLLSLTAALAAMIFAGEPIDGQVLRRLALVSVILTGTGFLYVGHCIQESSD